MDPYDLVFVGYPNWWGTIFPEKPSHLSARTGEAASGEAFGSQGTVPAVDRPGRACRQGRECKNCQDAGCGLAAKNRNRLKKTR